ncbi:MAG: hypothetical protein CMN30_09090 [Sandaracinus sp.]|nr:hypothetical protein [Sandaracinus sp.]|tara:strand:- start:2397 stop:3893 length:1497 start_codon:yes stop_codon:yes gene_type:complete
MSRKVSSTITPYFVLKFGGSSVARPRGWKQIARAARAHAGRGEHPVIVCSALGGVTDHLEALIAAAEAGDTPTAALQGIWQQHVSLARELGLDADAVLGERLAELTELATAENHGPAWRARIFAMGELMSTTLGAAYLRHRGIEARWVDARQLLCAETDPAANEAQRYLSARCDHSRDPDVAAHLERESAAVTITQGFIARNDAGETVLLGRGGSDTSAAYLAARLGARRLEIWTDVPGLFTIDPRRTDRSRLIPRVTYDEAAVLGALGAKVLHPRCLEPVREHGIPLAIRWTSRPELEGTVIGDGDDNRPGIKAVTSRSKLCLVSMERDREWQPVGFMAEVATCFHQHGLSMDLISSSPSEIRATIDLGANPGAEALLPGLLKDLKSFCRPTLHQDLTCVSVAGSEIGAELPRIAAIMHLLGEPRIHLASHAADDTHVSYVVDERLGQDLAVAIHEALFCATDSVPLGPTWDELHQAPPSSVHRIPGSAVKGRSISA